MNSAIIRPIKLTNSLTGKKEPLETIQPGKLTMYSCGPTVYSFIHIGNLRAGLVADMFHRYFKRVGYDVTFVRNYTDVDDKIIKRANEEKISSEAVAQKYTQEAEKDFTAAGIQDPTVKPTVTTHIPEIIQLIERIIKNGKAYVVDGEVLFAINKFPGYGKLSGKNIEELQAGARVGVNEKKQNPLDFSLWKPAKPGEPSWESPWGKGRPGWHIECSAMSSRWLGDQIDVHHGGEDLSFPHHENEIAQSEGASGKAPFVKYWLHHAFITMSQTKMSKSLGNVFLARDFLTQFSGEFARYFALSVHYRSPIDFSDDTIDNTLISLQRIYEAKQKAAEFAQGGASGTPAQAWTDFIAACQKAREQIDEAFANDFNSAEALAALYTLIRDFNRTATAAAGAAGAAQGARELVAIIEKDIGKILGVGLNEPAAALKDLGRIRAARPVAGGVEKPQAAEIEKLLAERVAARQAKDFARGDQIRKDLDARGIVIKDGPSGTTWSYK
ncbi:MAG: cysteine--tRNA ligase [Bdellovibrionales bacterium GWB1_52_6]|nr:MAG: cysteine--tRNA ligase [Bdellovibrionales bacterium GWB1_52_6]